MIGTDQGPPNPGALQTGSLSWSISTDSDTHRVTGTTPSAPAFCAVLAMAIVVAFGRGLDKIMIALALVQWRLYVRLLRAEILTLRERDFIQAAKTMGVSDITIMFKHILPNAIYPVLVVASLNVGSVVIAASFLSFIGLGASKGYADWGQMLALARNYIIGPHNDPLKYWYTILIPGIAMILFVLAWNLIGDAMRDAFDPRQRRR